MSKSVSERSAICGRHAGIRIGFKHFRLTEIGERSRATRVKISSKPVRYCVSRLFNQMKLRHICTIAGNSGKLAALCLLFRFFFYLIVLFTCENLWSITHELAHSFYCPSFYPVSFWHSNTDTGYINTETLISNFDLLSLIDILKQRKMELVNKSLS